MAMERQAWEEKRTWRCRVCAHEHTPRCPTCRVVITGLEAANGKCNTCGFPITAAIYTCPNCQTENALRPATPVIRPWHGRDLGIKGLQLLRLIVGGIQMAGLLMMAVACSAAFGGAAPQPGAPSLQTLQIGGFLTFVLLIPVQIVIARAIKAISYGTVVIGERRRPRDQDQRRRR
jgi:hypothetical protein